MISIVVLCFNDHENFQITLDSLENELIESDELIIVDSSHDENICKEQIHKKSFKCECLYFHLPPQGVYPSFNYALSKCSKEFIQKINSGDTLLRNSREKIKNVMVNEDNEIYVFSQISSGANSMNTIFTPNANSLWPMQSLIIKKELFRKYGKYDESFKFSADQMLFYKMRRSSKYRIYNTVITTYDTDGLSTSISLVHLNELWALHRYGGNGIIKSLFLAYFFPIVRRIIEIIFGKKTLFFLKNSFLSHYSSRKK